jgi:predicted RNase H-like nuclease (RuvC/YqgF family)
MGTDYNRQLNKEYERATLRVEELERENRELKAENRRFRHRVAELENTLEERIARAVDIAVAKAIAPLNMREPLKIPARDSEKTAIKEV